MEIIFRLSQRIRSINSKIIYLQKAAVKSDIHMPLLQQLLFPQLISLPCFLLLFFRLLSNPSSWVCKSATTDSRINARNPRRTRRESAGKQPQNSILVNSIARPSKRIPKPQHFSLSEPPIWHTVRTAKSHRESSHIPQKYHDPPRHEFRFIHQNLHGGRGVRRSQML